MFMRVAEVLQGRLAEGNHHSLTVRGTLRVQIDDASEADRVFTMLMAMSWSWNRAGISLRRMLCTRATSKSEAFIRPKENNELNKSLFLLDF